MACSRGCFKVSPAIIAWVVTNTLAPPPLAHGQAAALKPIRDAVDVSDSACLTADDLAADVAQRGYATVDAELVIRVREGDDTIDYLLSWDREPKRMDVRGDPCAARKKAVAVALALALDRGPPPPYKPEPPKSVYRPPREPGCAAPPASAVAGTPSAEDRGIRTNEITALVGVLPNITVAFAPSLDFSAHRSLDIRFSALFSVAVTTRLDPGSFEAKVLAGRLDACAKQRISSGRVRACLGIAGGVIPASGQGFDVPLSWGGPWVTVAGRLDGRWAMTPRFGMVVSLDMFVPVVRPLFEYRDQKRSLNSVSVSPVGFGFGLGPSVTFW